MDDAIVITCIIKLHVHIRSFVTRIESGLDDLDNRSLVSVFWSVKWVSSAN